MRVPYLWLKEYLPELDSSPEEIAEKLTLSGIEVESVEKFNTGIKDVVAGTIEKLESHPGKDNLSLVTLNTGNGDRRKVACGAGNVKVGQRVPVVLPGGVLPGGNEIKEIEIEGIKSQGMICSSSELQLDLEQEEEGILVIDNHISEGKDLVDFWEINDSIIHLGLTPNRADCLGLIGVAYELAAILGLKIKLPPRQPGEIEEDVNDYAAVRIEDENLCRRYTARIIRDPRLTPSPFWLQLRLLKAGLRPINSIVDITNYVMWEYGQPLHAFDYNLVKEGEVIVRSAREGDILTTIDGVQRNLSSENLVIADKSGPIGLAGVMGGENTEITPDTRAVLLESAYFNPYSIRRTARGLGLSSEASQRFEKGVAPEGVIEAQNRAAYLMSELANGKVLKGVIDNYPNPVEEKRISVRPAQVERTLGIKIPLNEIKDILKRLGLEIEKETDSEEIMVKAPTRRADLLIEEDIMEELARLYGYDEIPAVLPSGKLIPSREPEKKRALNSVRDFMTSCGFYEVITYSFINPRMLDKLKLPEEHQFRTCIELKNPISEEQGVMRTTLVPGMLDVIQYNLHYRVNSQLFFEIGSIFEAGELPLQELPEENLVLSLGGTGKMPPKNWNTSPQKVDFFYLKGAIEELLNTFTDEFISFESTQIPFLHPYQAASVFLGNEELGYIGMLHPDVKSEYDFKQEVVLAEINLAKLLNKVKLFKEFSSLPKYPASLRDIAVLVPVNITTAQVENCIRETGGSLVESILLFDLYEGKSIPAGYRSLAFSIVYRSQEQTLRDEQVSEVHHAIEEELYNRLGVELRK